MVRGRGWLGLGLAGSCSCCLFRRSSSVLPAAAFLLPGGVSCLLLLLRLLPVVGFAGPRSGPAASASSLVSSLVGSVLASGRGVASGCASGVDSLAVSAALAAGCRASSLRLLRLRSLRAGCARSFVCAAVLAGAGRGVGRSGSLVGRRRSSSRRSRAPAGLPAGRSLSGLCAGVGPRRSRFRPGRSCLRPAASWVRPLFFAALGRSGRRAVPALGVRPVRRRCSVCPSLSFPSAGPVSRRRRCPCFPVRLGSGRRPLRPVPGPAVGAGAPSLFCPFSGGAGASPFILFRRFP